MTDGERDKDVSRAKQVTGRRSNKIMDDGNNPCLKEHKMSLKCLNDNAYDKDKCDKHFQNYKNCKAFWDRVMKDRKKKGIIPHLPPTADRDSVKEEYHQFRVW